FQAEDGIRDFHVTGVQTCALPILKGKPIAVGGGGKRGVVSAASYEARKFGVKSAMAGTLAAKLCPDLTFVRPRFDRYTEISKKRSEERRVGKECRSRRSPYHEQKK